MKEEGPGRSIKKLKEYALMEEELYRRLPGGILFRCINEKEGKLRLEKLHTQVCNYIGKMSRMLILDIQGRELRCICYRRLEDSLHGILGSRNPTN